MPIIGDSVEPPELPAWKLVAMLIGVCLLFVLAVQSLQNETRSTDTDSDTLSPQPELTSMANTEPVSKF